MSWSIDESGVQCRTSRVMMAETGSPRTSAPGRQPCVRCLIPRRCPPSGRLPQFLIPPWIHIPNPASHVLANIRRKLPEDRRARCNLTPVPCETFVQVPPDTGTPCKESGWINVGTTKGRDATTGTTSTTNRKWHLALPRSEKTGKEPSTSEHQPTPERLLATTATPSGISCPTAWPVPSSCDGKWQQLARRDQDSSRDMSGPGWPPDDEPRCSNVPETILSRFRLISSDFPSGPTNRVFVIEIARA